MFLRTENLSVEDVLSYGCRFGRNLYVFIGYSKSGRCTKVISTENREKSR